MSTYSPTYIGRVRHVLGSTVTVALDPSLAGVAPIYRGHLQSVGQVGSLVRIPQGLVDLVASVTMLGISELAGAQAPSSVAQQGERWLQVQLLGELEIATGTFKRGIGSYPGLDDPVHFATPEQLSAIFPPSDDINIRIGCLSASEQVPVSLDASRLVVRHGAVVGSTGSGKTSTVVSLLQSFVRGGWKAANIVVIDPHGEYANAFGSEAQVRSISGDPADQRLRVPYWALEAKEILRAFTGMGWGTTATKRFEELVTEARRTFVVSSNWLQLDPAEITPDTPVPFNLRDVWHRLDYENRATVSVKNEPSTIVEITPGNAERLQPATFEPYSQGNKAPFRGPWYGDYATMPDMLRLGLLDPRRKFFQEPAGNSSGPDPLAELVAEWVGGDRPISILDFSGTHAVAADLAVGVVLHLLFEVCLRGRANDSGVGRSQPVLVVLEEAHRYLGEESTTALAQSAANRIAREGRKYGIGLLLVSQRPAELPDTALSQCGTLIALRLSNAADQGRIRAALPDTVSGLADVLPSLRTGEGVVSGEALVLPVRAVIDKPNPRPEADDPSLEPWREEPRIPDVTDALAEWRGQTRRKP